MRKTIIPALAAISLAAIATPASAETQSVEVRYADLDLTSQAGIAALESRIKAAARKICGTADVRNMQDVRDHRSCLRQTETSVSVELARLIGARPTLAHNNRR